MQKNVEICESLLQSGACVDLANNLGQTPLHLAAANGLVDCLQLLLSHAGANPSTFDNAGFLPAWHAIQNGHVPATIIFIKRNCPIIKTSVQNESGSGAIEIFLTLCRKKLFYLIQLLVASDYLDAKTISFWLSTQDCIATEGQEHQNLINWLTNFLYTPSSLLHLARRTIRLSIGVRLYPSLDIIPLPEQLKNYLILSDISEEIGHRLNMTNDINETVR